MDFYTIKTKSVRDKNREWIEISPDFVVGNSKDLMVRGGRFYAIWDEEKGLWSTDDYDVTRLVDAELYAYADKHFAKEEVSVKNLKSFDSQSWVKFCKFVGTLANSFHQLDEKLAFANTTVTKSDYISKRLSYSLEPGDHSAWDELTDVLYSPAEKDKIEWFIGALVSGDSTKIQKFGVFYGAPKTGKSTILNIIHRMFYEYTAVFDAKALGSSNNQFATEAFADNPLLAIQHDGDLSKIEDNTRLNSIVAHEDMLVNPKYRSAYMTRVLAILLMGTNQPVKISDARSGIIRRLIDINPTGNVVPQKQYQALMKRIEFEYGAIASKCLEKYQQMGIYYYDGYRPTEMMYKTDSFFNFVEHHLAELSEEPGISLKRAWTLYKNYADEAKLPYTLSMGRFREELKDYFRGFEHRMVIDGSVISSWFYDFDTSKFLVTQEVPTEEVSIEVEPLVLDSKESILDELLKHQPAQYGTAKEIPGKKWSEVTTVLEELNTKKLHFVKVPENHIVIDFDLTDEKGNKSLEKNLQAAALWPPTYAELSKGGGGVHLHYTYDGDVERLDSRYSDGIEVKTLLGNSSLRRRLTKCNNVAVSSISSGLPVKEKKMIAENTIKSEKGLRDLILRNLRKEIHPGTKSSVDFIKKILDDAYESGLQYDITDMRGDIVAFAANSSHQAILSIKMVQQMKFVGNQDAPKEEVVAADDRLVLFDVEVYPNLFVICWKYEGSDEVVRMINPGATDVEKLLKMRLVGFYNRRYDNHILYGAYMGYNNEQLYKLSQAIIEGKQGSMFGEAYSLSYADVWDLASVKMGLKKWEIELGILHKEMDIPWDQPVPEDRVDDVVEYCVNDVRATEEVLKARHSDLVARQMLAELSGLTVNDTTQAHTARIIFGRDRNPQKEFVYTDLSEEFPGYEFELNKSSYKGLDPSEGGYVYAEPGIHKNVAVLDVASMHPTSIIKLNLFGDYTVRFKELLDARLAIKHKDYAGARKQLDGRLEPFLKDEKDAEALAYALKIVINIVYGLTSAKFPNPFKDNRNHDNIVAKRGALFMIDLKEFVQSKGYTVAHIKTDSIKIPDATPEIIDDVMEFGQKYGYTFELETVYEKFCLVNDAVYIARKGVAWSNETGKWEVNECKWDAVGAQFQHPYVFKTLFANEKIDFMDLCEARSVSKGAMYLDFEHDRAAVLGSDGMQFVGKTGLFTPVVEEANGAMLYRVVDDKKYSVTGTKGYLWLEAVMARDLDPNVIDMRYFERLANEAVKTIAKFGSFEEFVS